MKLHDDLINEVEPHESVEDAVGALLLGIADRIEACHGNAVKLSDLCSVLREDPAKVGKAVSANTDSGEKVRTTAYDAPSPAFDKPREDVKPGMADQTNDHRDQVFPETDRTEAERENIKREQTAKDRGQAVVLNETV
jgi:cell pole-organizing protein PopZ